MKHSQFDDHPPDRLISKFSWSTTASCNRTAIKIRSWATLFEKINLQNPSCHQKVCTENNKMGGDLTITLHHWPCLLANNYNNNKNNNNSNNNDDDDGDDDDYYYYWRKQKLRFRRHKLYVITNLQNWLLRKQFVGTLEFHVKSLVPYWQN